MYIIDTEQQIKKKKTVIRKQTKLNQVKCWNDAELCNFYEFYLDLQIDKEKLSNFTIYVPGTKMSTKISSDGNHLPFFTYFHFLASCGPATSTVE